MDLKHKRPNRNTPTAQDVLKNTNNTESERSVVCKDDESIDDENNDSLDQSKRTLFCANLDERVTEELLYEAFLQAGPIERVYIPKDTKGQQRSYGFITYVYKCTVPYALQLYQGLTLYRKTLVIKTGNIPASAPSSMPIHSASKNDDNDEDKYRKRQRLNDCRPGPRPTQNDLNSSLKQTEHDWTNGSFRNRSGRADPSFNIRQTYSSTSTSSSDTNNNGETIRSVASDACTVKKQEWNQHRVEDLQQPFLYRENQYQSNKYKNSSSSNNSNNHRR